MKKFFSYPSPMSTMNFFGQNVYLKRDDLLELGCSKQRSIPFMIYQHFNEGATKFTISSTGNAALVAIYIAQSNPGIKELVVFFSDRMSDTKLLSFIRILGMVTTPTELRRGYHKDNIYINFVSNPKQQAFQRVTQGYCNLRGSTDEYALIGFASLADEIVRQAPQADSLFIPASSGSTALGVFERYQVLLEEKKIERLPSFNIIQTTKVYALLKNLVYEKVQVELEHPAEAILDIIGHRRHEVENLIRISQGKGWIISRQETYEAKTEAESILKEEISAEAALTLAAFRKSKGNKLFQFPVMIFTG